MNDELDKIESDLALCQLPSCNRTFLAEKVYRTVPMRILEEYSSNLEVNKITKEQRMLFSIIEEVEDTEFILYPHKKDYKDAITIFNRGVDPSESKSPLRVKFNPDIYNLGTMYIILYYYRPIGVTLHGTITLSNYEKNTNITIDSITPDVLWIEAGYDSSDGHSIAPSTSMKIYISFTAMSYGSITNYIVFSLNRNKSYFYKITYYGIKNNFGINPIIITENRKNIPIIIENPYKDTYINLYCAIQRDERISLKFPVNENLVCQARNPFFSLEPLKKGIIPSSPADGAVIPLQSITKT